MPSHDDMKEPLEGFIRKHHGFENANIKGLHRMPGGASKETWSFELYSNPSSPAVPMVLRINRHSPLPVSIDLGQEFSLMKAVHAAGIEVPKPYWYSEDLFDNPFYVIERIEGETIVRRLHREPRYAEARDIMPAQLGRILAKIHRIPEEGLGFLPRRGRGGSLALGEISFYEELFLRHSPDPHPALELAARWLRENGAQTEKESLVHGDYRLGNVIFGEKGVKSVLDWELSHIGDPMEDVGYITVQAWRFGNDAKPVGGIGTRDAFYRAYRQEGGFPLDPERIFFWEVFGNFKWAIITILQTVPFLKQSSTSVELASLGRKTAEIELQLLTLIEG